MDVTLDTREAEEGAGRLRSALEQVEEAARRAGAATEGGGAVAALERQAGAAVRLAGEMRGVGQAGGGVESALSRAFSGALRDGAELGQVARRLAFDLGKLAVQQVVAAPAAPAAGGGLAGLLGSLLGGLFGGARAFGGPVDAGRVSLVGERGPELFVPAAPGGIEPLPRHASEAAAGPVSVTVNISTQDAASFKGSAGQIGARLADAVRAGLRNR